MGKIASFLVVGILLCLLIGSQAYAGYEIVWWGDSTGSIPTTETARSQQASIELFNQLFPDGYYPYWDEGAPYPEGTCVEYDYSEYMARASAFLSVCESGHWIENSHGSNFGGPFVREGYWSISSDGVLDGDGDGIPDESDNCPAVANASQKNVDVATETGADILGDVCDSDTIYGVNPDYRYGYVKLFKTNCGGDILIDVPMDSSGYFSYGNLEIGQYLLKAYSWGYESVPVTYWVYIPQNPVQSYNFSFISPLIGTWGAIRLNNEQFYLTFYNDDYFSLSNENPPEPTAEVLYYYRISDNEIIFPSCWVQWRRRLRFLQKWKHIKSLCLSGFVFR